MDEKKILLFDYQMQISYECPVERMYVSIKGIPVSTDRQEISILKLELLPKISYSLGSDSFGNCKLYGHSEVPHQVFAYHICGEAEIGQILYEEDACPELIPVFRHPYGLNKAGSSLREYFAGLAPVLGENDYLNAVYLMRRLYEDFTYKKGVTGTETSAEEAWQIGKGVCQDYAHILIALCHMAGIPARYVTGMMIGEGQSHAWVEILYAGKWIGLDPTNNLLIAERHIKISHGRDASDCQINRGLLYGGGRQTQLVKAIVKEKETEDYIW